MRWLASVVDSPGSWPYLCYWGHGKLQGWARHAVGEVHLILLCEALVLGVRRPAVLCDERIHGDVGCGLCFSGNGLPEYSKEWRRK